MVSFPNCGGFDICYIGSGWEVLAGYFVGKDRRITIRLGDSKAESDAPIGYPRKELLLLCLSSKVHNGRNTNTVSASETPQSTSISLVELVKTVTWGDIVTYDT
jgi:hypothetical protein